MKPNKQSPGWSGNKPTTPGEFWTCHNGFREVFNPIKVTVSRHGRGLRVIPVGPWPPVAMSDIEPNELLWHQA